MRKNDQFDRFPIAKRGYDPHAVEAFLEVSSSESDRMLDDAAAQIAALEVELEEIRKQEEAVHLTILAATKAKEDMLAAAQHQADEQGAKARKEGDRIVTDARMQAFKLVTGAREETETIVGEARSEAAAIARIEGASAAAVVEPSNAETALQARIEAMQGVIEAMEHELATRPTTADPLPREEETSAAVAEADTSSNVLERHPEPEALDEGIEVVMSDTAPMEATDDADSMVEGEPVITIDPEEDEVAAPLVDAAATVDASVPAERTPEAIRRSFYSRRSAKLPQIGAEAGRGAMAAVAGLRTNLMATEVKDDTDPEPSPAFEAV
jgi:cell division septum initiation protein DivIVA